MTMPISPQALVNAQDHDGRTPLHTAVVDGRDVLEALIEYGAEALARDKDGRTPLHLAAANGHMKDVLVLIRKGGDAIVREWRTRQGLREWNGFDATLEEVVGYISDIQKPEPSSSRSSSRRIREMDENIYSFSSRSSSRRIREMDENIYSFSSRSSSRRIRNHKRVREMDENTNWLGLMVECLSREPLFNPHTRFLPNQYSIRQLLQETEWNSGQIRSSYPRLNIGRSVLDLVHSLGIITRESKQFTWVFGIVLHLITRWEIVNAQDALGQAVLYSAAEAGNCDVVKFLLDATAVGVAVTMQDVQTAFEVSAKNKDEKTIQVLLYRAVDMETRNGQIALRVAVDGGWQNTIEMLLKRDVNVGGEDGRRALQLSVDNRWQKTMESLIQRGVDITGESGQEALQLAVDRQWQNVVELLLNGGISVTGESGQKLLEQAVSRDINIMRLLLKRADVETVNRSNALWWASKHRDRRLVKLLCESGVDINAKYDGKTVLHVLAGNDEWDLVEALVEYGADVNEVNEDGETVLHLAVQDHQKRTVGILVRKGAEHDRRNNDGVTPWEMMDDEHREIILAQSVLYKMQT